MLSKFSGYAVEYGMQGMGFDVTVAMIPSRFGRSQLRRRALGWIPVAMTSSKFGRS